MEALGITYSGFIRFFMQAGLALAAASALWGLVVAWRMKVFGNRDRLGAEVLTYFLGRLFGLGFSLYLVSWWVSYLIIFVPTVAAHEGITIRAIPDAFVQAGFVASLPVQIVAFIVAAAGLFLFREKRELFIRYAKEFFLAALLLTSALMYLTNFTGSLDREQIFLFFHSWHSVLTLGTVLVIDSLYIVTRRYEACRRVLYRMFPYMSMTIWVGLGIDFLNNTLIYGQQDWSLPVFHYTQIIVAIIIINGTLLSGRLNDALLHLIKPDGSVGEFDTKTERLASFAGAISIVSWMTITFSDSFTLTVPAWAYFGLWGFLIAVVYILRNPLHRIIQTRLRV